MAAPANAYRLQPPALRAGVASVPWPLSPQAPDPLRWLLGHAATASTALRVVPDSSWSVSTATGLAPGNHGITRFQDFLNRGSTESGREAFLGIGSGTVSPGSRARRIRLEITSAREVPRAATKASRRAKASGSSQIPICWPPVLRAGMHIRYITCGNRIEAKVNGLGLGRSGDGAVRSERSLTCLFADRALAR